MRFTGNVAAVLQALHRNSNERPWLHVCSGVKRGAISAGAMVAFCETGVDRQFTHVTGCSTGNPNVVFLQSGNPAEGARIYAEECCTPEFFDWRRWRNQVDISYLSSLFWERINVDRVLAHPATLVMLAADVETAKPLYITPKNAEELHGGLAGSVSIQGLNTDKFYYRGRHITDAAGVEPIPWRWWFSLPEQERPTHLLILANREQVPRSRALEHLQKEFEWFLFKTFFRERLREFSPEFDILVPTRQILFRSAVETVMALKDLRVTICWQERGEGVSSFERDPKKILATTERARVEWLRLLEEKGIGRD